MNFLKNLNVEKYQNKINEFIIKKWLIIHVIFIGLYVLYLTFKIFKGGKVFSNNFIEYVYGFSLQWFIINIIGFGILSYVFLSERALKFWQYISLVIIGFSVISYSYIKTIDPNLIWDGSDVPIGNYVSAQETVKYGTLDLLKTWNDRANPYDSGAINYEIKDSIRKFVAHYNLSGLTFDKWKNKLDTGKYEINLNNRPYVHSPFPTLIMGWWLKIFPFERWSIQVLMLILTISSILLVLIYAFKNSHGNIKTIVLISIATSPVMFKYPNPSTDQLSMFLFTLPVFLFLMFPSKRFLVSFLYGLIFGLCIYSKFTVFVFIFLLVISLLIYRKNLTLKPMLGLITGIILPIIIFTASGYYFWLTIISGQIITKLFAINNPISFYENMTKFLYFGPSFLLLTVLLMVNSNRLKEIAYPYFLPTIISLFFLIIYLYDQGTWNRYLSQYLPSIAIFLLSSEEIIELKKKDLFISVFANFVFINLNIYF